MSDVLQIVTVNALGATLLAGVVAIGTRFIARPAVVHALWLLVLVELVSLPVLEMAVLPAAPPANGLSTPSPGVAAAGSTALIPWVAVVTALWLGVALCVLALALYRSLLFGRLLRTARPPSGALDANISALARRLGITRCPEPRVVPAVISPMLWFTGRSLEILLPEGLLCRLSPRELQALITHELAHVHRRDHWVRWFELLVGALFWWHPVTWWARQAMRNAEEASCDAWVVRTLPTHTEAYATCLLKTVEFLVGDRRPVPALACGAGKTQRMEERLTMILQRRISEPSSRGQRWLLAIAAGALLFVVPTISETTGPAYAQGAGSEQTLVTVNGLPVTPAQLETAPASTLAQGERLANAVDEMLLVSRGRQLGYALTDQQFQRVLDGIKEEREFDDAQLVVALERDEGMTVAQLRDVMERQMQLNQVRQRLGNGENLDTLRDDATIVWEDEALKGLYDGFLARQPR